MKAGEKLVADLAALRQQPNSDLATVRAVEIVLSQYAGQRVTLPGQSGRARRVQQASVLLKAIGTDNRATGVRAIAGAMGVHKSTVYRYLRGT